MLIGGVLALFLFPYLGVVVPINRMFAARQKNDVQAIMRWSSFLTCTLLVVVPLAMIIPSWLLFYYDIIWCALVILSVYDATLSEHIVVQYINPQVAQIRMLLTCAASMVNTEKHVVEEDSSDDEQSGEKED